MSSVARFSTAPKSERVTEHASRALYFALAKIAPEKNDLQAARQFLTTQLAAAKHLPADIPANVDDLADWIGCHVEQVGLEYKKYIDARKNGAPRRYFSNKSHALYFLKSVAPTKLVDGAWLYGLLQRWNDPDFSTLIRIYLEELGNGVADKNHVVLYKQALAAHGCDQWENLSDEHFVQGAIQLAFACDAEHFLPELIGYNLGYEQLPLHLLITAYELNELGMDPYYFTLHITVDNAATGHAHKALQGLLQLMPRVGDADAFYRRVMDGYRLNDLGAGTSSVIASFDIQRELVGILAAKSVVGKHMHSDYCRVAGRTVNDWLSDPAQIPDFLQNLEKAGWIKRGENPQNSRFWRLIQSERAEMFGVFNAYEQQILHDWIAAIPPSFNSRIDVDETMPRVVSHRARQRALDTLGRHAEHPHRVGASQNMFRHRLSGDARDGSDFNSDLRCLEEQMASLGSKEESMQTLIKLMSPANHHTTAGLMATRMFIKLLA